VHRADPRAVRAPGEPVLLHGTALGRRDHRPRRHPPRARHGPRRLLPGAVARARPRPVPAVSTVQAPGAAAPRTGRPPFPPALVAHAGEIACRILGALRRLGIRPAAGYSAADRDAPHVLAAAVAVRLGPAPARESYLDVDAVVAAASQTGAEAIHPGYGFL